MRRAMSALSEEGLQHSFPASGTVSVPSSRTSTRVGPHKLQHGPAVCPGATAASPPAAAASECAVLALHPAAKRRCDYY